MNAPLTVAVSLILVLGVVNILYLRRKARFITDMLMQSKRELSQLSWDTEQLRAMVPPGTILPRPDAWSMACDGLQVIVREIERRRPGLIVELGSGLSTVVMATRLRQLGAGRIVAVDHDAAYAERTRAFLRLNDLDDLVEVRVASLKRQSGPEDRPPWYDSDALSDLAGIDMLVVDGPPMPVHPEVRGATLPFFRDRLGDNWLLVLDNAERAGERAVLRAWEAEPPGIAVDLLKLQKTVAMVRPTPAKAPEVVHAG